MTVVRVNGTWHRAEHYAGCIDRGRVSCTREVLSGSEFDRKIIFRRRPFDGEPLCEHKKCFGAEKVQP